MYGGSVCGWVHKSTTGCAADGVSQKHQAEAEATNITHSRNSYASSIDFEA